MALQATRQLSHCMVVIILYLQATMAFVAPHSLSWPTLATTVSATGSGTIVAAHGRSKALQPLSLSTGAMLSRRCLNRPRGTWAPAWAGKPGTFGRGGADWRRRSSNTIAGSRGTAATSSTALHLGVGNGDDLGPGDKDGWRQRMVRTIVTTFLRIRAVLAAVGARLGLGRTAQANGRVSNRSLYRTGQGNSFRAAVGSKYSLKTAALLVTMFVFAFTVRTASMRAPVVTEVPMSTFMKLIGGKMGKAKAVVDGVRVTASGKMYYRMNGKQCYTMPLSVSKEVFKALSKSGVPYTAVKASPAAYRTLSALFPLLYLGAIYYFIFKKGQRDMVGSAGKLASSSELDRSLTFGDVAGVDQAKGQVQELVSMIKNPAPFLAAGARLPSGLLMVGPPGTGKTLLARVMAAEAGVPFFYCSGSDFVEMYVGRGAARVRKLFVKAAKNAPCIVFLDELDALGKERSSGGGGRQTNDEVEQTLNQLLACMDGLDTNNNGVTVIAATNRFEVLDTALTRPGRFDRIVRVDVPDAVGREAILKVHTRKMNIEDPTVLREVAEVTPGLAGADLASIANEAAISAARRGSMRIVQADLLSSVRNFYDSRKKGAGGLPNMFKGMLG